MKRFTVIIDLGDHFQIEEVEASSIVKATKKLNQNVTACLKQGTFYFSENKTEKQCTLINPLKITHIEVIEKPNE